MIVNLYVPKNKQHNLSPSRREYGYLGPSLQQMVMKLRSSVPSSGGGGGGAVAVVTCTPPLAPPSAPITVTARPGESA